MKLQRLALSYALVLCLSACIGETKTENPIQTEITETETTGGVSTGGATTGGTTTNGTTDSGTTGGDTTGGGANSGGQNVNNARPVYRTPAGVQTCSVDDVKRRVDFDMRDYYIFYDSVPLVNLNDYETPESLMTALRVDPDVFSYVTDAAEQTAVVDNGLTNGYGFWFGPALDDVVRMRDVRAGSPADELGILRGDEILTFNGKPMADVTQDDIDAAFSPENLPILMTIRSGDDAPRDVIVNYGEYRWRTAGPANRYTNSNEDLPVVGYIPIRRFLETTRDEIDQSLAALEELGGFDELVIDMRYNGGGRISVIRHLASIVGGAAVANNAFQISQWNDKYPENKSVTVFDEVEKPLNLPRVFVLVSEFSGSSPEMFINALEPYIDVVVIGGVTEGSSFSSTSQEYCDKSINAMSALRVNALGVAVEFGVQPDCAVEDNWLVKTSNVNDPLLSGVLNFVVSNACPAPISEGLRAPRLNSPGLSHQEPEPLVPDY